MRAQNINYYSSLMENAPDDFDFGVIQIPEKEKGSGHWSWGGGFVLEVPQRAQKSRSVLQVYQSIFSTPKFKKNLVKRAFDIMANRSK